MTESERARICPECDSDRVQASTASTRCLDCGARFQSGLQRLAERFDI